VARRNNPDTALANRTLVVERVFDAPRDLVFRMWTDEKHVAQWWGPQGFEVTYIKMDVRPGGTWRKAMRSLDRKEYWRSGVYQEVIRPERLVFTYFSDDPNSKPGHETVVTVTFEEHEGRKTKLTLRQAVFESVAARDAHQGGWTSVVERLAGYMARA
jgi:uncharacterized protein YndB with AHSA1/START domain